MIVILEGIVMCFILLLVCVIGIRNGAVGLVTFYEKDVQERVAKLGLTTKEKIKRSTILSGISIFVPTLFLVPYMVYGLNGVSTFKDGFIQMFVIYMIMNLFDRLFIDWYWVGHTRTWEIKGTEDLKPYIPKRVVIRKWVSTLIAFPLLALGIAYLMTMFI